MQEMLDEEDEEAAKKYARIAQEQRASEEILLGVTKMYSPSASWESPKAGASEEASSAVVPSSDTNLDVEKDIV